MPITAFGPRAAAVPSTGAADTVVVDEAAHDERPVAIA
jgi:hypothetical protein